MRIHYLWQIIYDHQWSKDSVLRHTIAHLVSEGIQVKNNPSKRSFLREITNPATHSRWDSRISAKGSACGAELCRIPWGGRHGWHPSDSSLPLLGTTVHELEDWTDERPVREPCLLGLSSGRFCRCSPNRRDNQLFREFTRRAHEAHGAVTGRLQITATLEPLWLPSTS